ncbi:CoA transferase [Parahaliea maris]|uniref:CoA transferase n=1 Tax=Parahaliea maris TaxID=2716870 RepID=A0A5C8ZVV3_9GAMM|nr:CaiB/BaiF CoA-transferase family protein [Parahaliea maris]TXS91989.1 CoA transferase [Parahaliea maris]
MTNTSLPLKNIKVVELSHMVMGPATGVILADLGAEVIKIEPLKGDNTRRLKGSGAGYFPMYNRNKRSLCLDLKSEEGLEVVRTLIAQADVVIENFRPGALAAMGLDYETLSRAHPGLIYCSLKGFLSGPYQHRTALDEVAQMMGGLAYMTGLPDKPMRAGSSVIDITGAMFGVIGILAALEERHASGRGKFVTSALFETTAYMVGQHMAQCAVSGEAPPPMSIRRSAWGVYDTFEAADGEKVFVAVVSDTQWRQFCLDFGLEEFANDPSLAANSGRFEQRDRIIPAISEVFASLSKASLMEKLDHTGLPYAPINRPEDLFDDPHLNAHGLLDIHLPDGSQTKLPALPIEMNGERFGLRYDPPAEAGDTRATLKAAGFDQDSIDKLVTLGVLRDET